MRALFFYLLVAHTFLPTIVQAQDPVLESFLSAAYSIYVEVTSILASDANNTPTTTATSASSSSLSTAAPSSSPSTAQAAATSSLSAAASSVLASSTLTSQGSSTFASLTSTSPTSSNSASAAAAATASSISANKNGNHHNNLAIILGCLLGAIALGLLILLLLICCRRRRRRANSPDRMQSPTDEEYESWRKNDGLKSTPRRGILRNRAAPAPDHEMTGAVVPSMTEYPATRSAHENPFVPVPPPPRRSTPNNRAGFTDNAVRGQESLVSAQENGHHNGHHRSEALGAGLGGAALGAAALHHHDKKESERGLEADRALETRKGEAGTVLDNGYTSHDPGLHHDHHEGEALTAGAGGAALGAAAIHHHDKNEMERDSEADRLSEKRYSGNRTSIPRKPVPSSATFGSDSDATVLNERGRLSHGIYENDTPPRGMQDELNNSQFGEYQAPLSYEDQPHNNTHGALTTGAAAGAGALGGAAMADHHHHKRHHQQNSNDAPIPLENVNDFPSEPTPRSSGTFQHRQNLPSADGNGNNLFNTGAPTTDYPPTYHAGPPLGTAAPAAALGAHTGGRRGTSPATSLRTGRNTSRHRNSTPPAVPSRSPKRTRFSDNPFDVPGSSSHTSSDSSTFRLSSGMPGGWRHSLDSESERALRGTRFAPGNGNGNGNGNPTPRLSDLRAEQEEQIIAERQRRGRGRSFDEEEWMRGLDGPGGGSRGGFRMDGRYPVGQAL